VIVIDPASPYSEERIALDEVIAALAAAGRHVRAIWLTHHHGDHVGGAAYLAKRLGVSVAAHPATAARMGDRVAVDRLLNDGDLEVLESRTGPPRRLRALFTPGHAPGHLCFFEETSRFLVAGDMVAGIGSILVEPIDGNMRLYLESLARMKQLAPGTLLPAHGPPVVDAIAKIDEYAAHRLWREAQVLAAVRARGPAPPHELVEFAYADAAKEIHGLAARSLIAHLIKLESEGLVRRNDVGALEGAWAAVSSML
jgi:glyoxylase-like metal-dependent hydrolase (beta-lactamase superfamily II)